MLALFKPLARNNFLPVLESWVTQLFQLGAATVTMGDIAGQFTSDVTARLPSAALWSACSLTSVSQLFCHAGDSAAGLVPFQPMAHGFTL